MKQLIILFFIFLVSLNSGAQELSLDSCQSMARRNHALLSRFGIIDQVSALNQRNIEVLNLPKFDFTLRGSWQSEVTKVEFNNPNFAGPEPLSKDQYKAVVDIRQKIFDGGVAKKRGELEEADRQVSRQQTETELYKIRESVNTFFFNALIVQENIKIVNLKKETLDARIKTVGSAVKNGAALPNELDQLTAEKLLAEQQEIELISARQISLALLEILTGTKIAETTSFVVPASKGEFSQPVFTRPELTLFALQQLKLDKQEEIIKSSRKPCAYAFGQAGYGRPGLNMLNNSFDDWYMIGAGLTWNIFDWHQSGRERAIVKLQKDLIKANIDNLNRSFSMAFDQEEKNFRKIKALIETDEQIVTIRDQISRRSEAALENGAITSADYIRDLNSSLQAKANLETRKIQLIQSSINIQTILGK